MNIEELLEICQKSGRRPVVIESGDAAVVAVQGLEGRLYYVTDGVVRSLFRREAAENFSNSRNGYFNPGGDGLWPAPEGTSLGYQYTTGSWRVSTALCSAQYETVKLSSNCFEISAEVDLVNNQQLGIPCRFTRKAEICKESDGRVIIDQCDSIEYIGSRSLKPGEFLLAPWSLSQFKVSTSTVARFGKAGVRDLYMPSAGVLSCDGDVMLMRHDQQDRIQLALPESSRFVELVLPEENLRITRFALPLECGQGAVDIADASPDTAPGDGVRLSIYNDPSGFMELEVVGGGCQELVCGTVMTMRARNEITAL